MGYLESQCLARFACVDSDFPKAHVVLFETGVVLLDASNADLVAWGALVRGAELLYVTRTQYIICLHGKNAAYFEIFIRIIENTSENYRKNS